MKEIFRSNNPVQLSYVQACLRDAGVEPIQMDQHTSAIEGSISAIERRIMVIDEEYERAVQIFNEIKDTL